jgi:hypothetical protein
MKTVIIITLLTIIFTSAQGQDENSFFEYKKDEKSKFSWSGIPKIEKYNIEGKIFASIAYNQDYFRELFYTIAKKSFTKDEIELLDTRGNGLSIKCFVDSEGNFIWCEYRLTKSVIEQFSEGNLLKFYKTVMKTKLDTSMWGEINEEFLGSDGKFDCLYIGKRISPKAADRHNKWRREQKSKK